MKENVAMLIGRTAISKRIDEIAEQIAIDFKDETLDIICVLKGGVVFMVDLAKKLPMPVRFHFMDVKSYGDQTESCGEIKIIKDLDEPIVGKNVLLVEDIIDSGRTLSRLIELLKSRSPKSLTVCTLLDKPDRRVCDVVVQYTGFTIPDAFVVGYGLDYAQRYRNLDYIGVVSFEE